MRLSILAALLAIGSVALHAQSTGNTTIQPDCLIPFTFTAAGSFPATPTTNGAGDNRTKGCAAWTLMYQNSGMTSVSVTLQSGSSVSTTVSWGSFAGTISTGFVNPIVSDTGGSLQAVNGTADISWVRVNVAATGTGTLTGVLYGFRNSSAAVNGGGGGGTCPQGPSMSVQFSDGTNCQGSADLTWSGTTLAINSFIKEGEAALPAWLQGYTGQSQLFTSPIGIEAIGGGIYLVGASNTPILAVESYATSNSDNPWAGAISIGTGGFDIGEMTGWHIYGPGPGGAGSMVNGSANASYGIWFDAQTFNGGNVGGGWQPDNPYFMFLISTTNGGNGGVVRWKEDHAFDSVYQPIYASYNPKLTTYTAGAPNYERWVQQWQGDVSEIGNYAGGSGTLRVMRALGAGLHFGRPSNIALTTFTGAGLNDGILTGTYTGSTLTYCAIIDGTGTPDTFKWGTNGSCDNGAATVPITGHDQSLSSGVLIKFAATTGHTLTNKWSVVATAAADLSTLADANGVIQPAGYKSSDGTTGTTGNGFKDGLCVTASGACTGGISPTDPVFTTVQITGHAFAALGTPGNGTEEYCSDCTVTSGIDDTCAASGSGAWAQRINGAWKCNI